MKNFFLISFFSFFCTGFFFSCKDGLFSNDQFTNNTSYRVSFSVDTLSFDTVFSTVMTPTQRLMVYNNTSENIRIENITLFSGSNYFQVNVNGRSGTEFRDIEIRSNDSLYIFVQVMVKELKQNAPLQILDSLVFRYNKNIQKVMLQVFGQDVHLLRNKTIAEDTRWTNDKPYLIYDTLTVAADATLTIDAGAKLYFHNKATMLINGRLEVNGSIDHPVLFRGDRLDDLYADTPYDKLQEQWGGLLFTKESTENRINGAIIRNGLFGIQIDSAEITDVYRLIFSNSQIHNTKQAAFKATNAHVYAYNSIFSNGSQTCVWLEGGEYLFNHCTIAGYAYGTRGAYGALILSNYAPYNNAPLIPLKAEFNNCILYGTLQQELKLDNLNGNSTSNEKDFKYQFRSCLIRYQPNNGSALDIHSTAFQNVIWNENPDFQIDNDSHIYDFHLGVSSAAIDKGDPAVISAYPECASDKDGMYRNDGKPDIGAYELKAEK